MASRRPRGWHGHEWRTVLLGLLVIIGTFEFRACHNAAFQYAELKSLDLRLASHHSQPTGHVAIAAIDDKSIAALGRWPWPRTDEAQLVNALRQYGVKVIGFDVEFSEADPADVARDKVLSRLSAMDVNASKIAALRQESNTLSLAQAIHEQGATYLGYGFNAVRLRPGKGAVGSGYVTAMASPPPLQYNLTLKAPGSTFPLDQARAYLPPLAELGKASAGLGFVNVTSDIDGVYRTEYMVVKFDGAYCVPLSLALARAWLGNPPLTLRLSPRGVQSIMLGRERIPTDEVGRLLLNFRGYERTIPHYSVVDIINHKVPAADLAGKVILVGVTGQALGDRLDTPVDAYFPGVELHATAVDDILRGDFLARSEMSAVSDEVIAAIALGLIATIATALLSAVWSAAITVALTGIYFGYAEYRLFLDGSVVRLVFPLVTLFLVYAAVVLFRYFTEGLEKARLRRAFEHYLHPDVIRSVVDDPRGLKLGGQRRRLAVLFADVVGSTTLAEKMEPQALVEMLTAYMTAMIDIIMRSGGVVDKLMGDGIMAFWGTPQEMTNPSRAALDAAVQMLARLREMRATDPRFEHFNIGIGIHTGEVTVGNFGGTQFFNYTAIGDPVNFASRLEGLTRKFKVNLLVSRDTLNEAGQGFLSRDVGRVIVKGKALAVAIAEVGGHLNDGVDPEFYAKFEEVVDLIRAGSVDGARAALEKLAGTHPDDEIVHLYLDKLQDRSAVRQEGGELVFEFDSK